MRVRISCCFPATSREGRCERDASTTLPDARLGGQQRDGRPGTARRQRQSSGARPPKPSGVGVSRHEQRADGIAQQRDSRARARHGEGAQNSRRHNQLGLGNRSPPRLFVRSSRSRARAHCARCVAGRTRKMGRRCCGPHGWGSTPGWLQQLLRT